MKLKKLIKDIPSITVKGPKEIDISGITANSKLLVPGNLFIAKKGLINDGNAYIPEAIQAGASAILTDIYDPSLKHVTQLIHPNVASIEGLVADTYYQSPSQKLLMIGVTGTNGKTTSSYAIKHLLDSLYGKCGLLGTVEYLVGDYRYQASRTTPDVCTNHKFLKEMVNNGCTGAVMEVTSHALVQHRIDHIEFDIGIFTNLTQDHLDYHKTMDQYCLAKSALFSSLQADKTKEHGIGKWAIINIDDPWHDQIVEKCSAHILTFGIEQDADVRALNVHFDAHHTQFDVLYKGQTIHFQWPLVGRFNVYNALAAISVGLAIGLTISSISNTIKTFKSAPGRLESVPNPLNLAIFVDYAHTDDALSKVLASLNEIKKGKIITVFGCGGDRDRPKRPKMARAVEEKSDIVILTSDNPRSEDPMAICQDAIAGFLDKDRHIVEIDRRLAIQRAVEIATPDDIVLIAGKGHETVQIFAHRVMDFDDRLIAQECCQDIFEKKASMSQV